MGCAHLHVEFKAGRDKPWICPDCRHAQKEDPHDRFFTQATLATKIAAWAKLRPGMRVLEPSAGNGALARACEGHQVTCVELVPEAAAALQVALPWATVVNADFLTWQAPHAFDVAIMNPPYSSQPGADGLHVSKALRVAYRAVAVVRTNFLHGFQRYHQLFRWTRLTRQVVLSRRPGFDGPADSGFGARHDYQILEIERRGEERRDGELDMVAQEFWLL